MRWVFTAKQKQKSNTLGTDISRQVPDLFWDVAADMKLRRELAAKPYSTGCLETIAERFPGTDVADVVRAVAWAEPEGRYDWGFKQSEAQLQKEELRKQEDRAVEINKQLVQFSKKYAKQFRKMPKEFVYSGLSAVAFGTSDLAEIEQRFAQHERRDIKLSIVDLIENTHRFTTGVKPVGKKIKSVAVVVLSIILLIESSASLLALKGKYYQKSGNDQGNEQVLGIGIQKENKALPARLKIPAINVETDIQHVGVNAGGEMEVPSNTVEVGWFALGPRPGETGSAVIAGHFNDENGAAGVFADLHKLKEGDKIYIEDDRGTLTAFVVRESRTYDPGYADEVFSGNDGPHLNLITCEGWWDEAKQSFTERLVVFADAVD